MNRIPTPITIKKLSHFHNSRLFAKYLISYLVVLTIPLLGLGIFVYNYYFNALEKEVIKNNTNMLSHIQTSIDTKISELHTIAYQMYNNPKLTTYKIQNNPLDSKEGIVELKNYIIGNKFIDEAFIYYDRIGRTYSSSSTLTIPEFFQLYKYDHWNEKQFLQDMVSIRQITVHSSESIIKNGQSSPFVTYFVPDSGNSYFDKKMIFFLIDNKSITNILKNYRGNTIIINDAGIVSSLYQEDYLFNQKLRSWISNQTVSDSTILDFDGTEYFVSYLKSEATNWTYVTFLPVKEAMDPVISAKLIFLYGFFLVLIVASIVITYIMKLNYSPLKQLKAFAETKLGKPLNSSNEIEAVRLTLDQMDKTSKELNFKIRNNRTAVKEFLLHNLLQGHYSNLEKFNEKGKDLSILFTNSQYQVVILSLVNPELPNKINISGTIETIEKNLPENIEGYGKSSLDEDRIILILALPSSENRRVLKDYLYDLQHMLLNETNLQSTFGVGNSYSQLNEIGKSYIQATTALDYRLIKGKNRIIFFDEVLPPSSFITDYPISDLEALERSIIEGNIDQISNIIESVIHKIKNTDMPLFAAKCLCFDIINTLIKSICMVNKEFIHIKQNYPDVLSLTEFETVEELGDMVKKISSDIFTYIQDSRENQEATLTHNMIDYINENYGDYNFSIQSMADYFGMSLSNLSHYFKRATEHTISDYVDYLRIKKAKELLVTNEAPLSEVITHIGYIDTSSFVRKFKKVVGTTPGNYRKINKTQ